MRTTVGLRFLYGYMKYEKLPIDLPQQLEILKQRGLNIPNEDLAMEQLGSISYFKLANYWRSVEEQGSDKHQFLPNSSFDDVINSYVFDKKLRAVIFTSIQDMEVAIRTRVLQYFSIKYGAFWFMDASLFKDKEIHETCLKNITKEVFRSKEDFLLEHFAKYDEPSLPPVWKTMEVVSFGTLSKLYCNFADVEVKKQVAKSLSMSQYTYLESWLKSATVLRNCCAHHARLWNRRFAWKPQLPQKMSLAWIDAKKVRPIKLYAQLCYLAYLEQSINPNSSFRKEIVSLLSDKPQRTLKAMGFPIDWKDEPLWQC